MDPEIPAMVRRFGASRIGVWAIKNLISRLDRWIYQRTGGRWVSTGRPLAPMLLLTTTGRRTGNARTTPVFYLRDGDRLVLCNANPGFGLSSQWTLNLRANPIARVQTGRENGTYQSREAAAEEVERYWPQLLQIWPVYREHYERSGQRVLFVLDPIRPRFSEASRSYAVQP